MKRFFNSHVITAGLAVFSMFFGASNLMFPIKVGLFAGDQNLWAITGFSLTAVLLPLLGLIGIVLFNGDYVSFFYRLGRIPGFLLLFFCVNVIGPLIAMPRIVTFSYVMIEPFIPTFMNWLPLFSLLFLFFTFLATYKESKIVDLLGHFISPLLLISLAIIIIKGLLTATHMTTAVTSGPALFAENLVVGYQTLDLLGGIFFASILITILQKSIMQTGKSDPKKLAWFSFKSGLLGVSLLAIIYIGLSYIGAYFGHGLEAVAALNAGELFRILSFKIVGNQGTAIIGLAVLMACYSTIIALAAVYAEFLDSFICNKRLGYIPALIITLCATFILSLLGLGQILEYSKPIIVVMYPALIMLTVVNIAYKLFNFSWVKTPVAITFIISLSLKILYYMNIL